jgi:hypothetical protein
VFRLDTLALGWAQVKKNARAAGVDRMSVKRFAQAQDRYLAELAHALQDAFFANLGLFTMSEALRLARQSRCGNN